MEVADTNVFLIVARGSASKKVKSVSFVQGNKGSPFPMVPFFVLPAGSRRPAGYWKKVSSTLIFQSRPRPERTTPTKRAVGCAVGPAGRWPATCQVTLRKRRDPRLGGDRIPLFQLFTWASQGPLRPSSGPLWQQISGPGGEREML